MTFLIAQDDKPSPPDSYGSFIGILDPSTQRRGLHQLAMEFDTYRNERKIDGNHVAIVTTNMESPVAVKSLNDIEIDLRSGRNITIKIDYDGWTKVLDISAAYARQTPVKFLSQEIIMQETVPQNAYVGFLASTAYFSKFHQLLNWNFTLYELPERSLKYGSDPEKEKIALLVAIPMVVVSLALAVSFPISARKGRKERLQRKEDIEMLTRTAANAPQVRRNIWLNMYNWASKAQKLGAVTGPAKSFLIGIPDSRFLSGLASALVYIHEECGNPIVHRDVKPNNVMLDSEYNAHLGDFGLARLLQNDNFVTTMVVGTPG
ncbi:PREDICTED: probable L-type lectin-domain containing receptor kinase S.7 [Nicotiana attenuata]|uniref:probable L-type lectin-domain containing receptor kinase S.7 n=1 Tax=Nicotiana attenuata TaxID=49451 RepID=UPI000905CF29|nr:PREDICTED: probable L-type lectin-domain containing receptor kinase S.7 [Nicotiana attenuata]